MLKALKKIFGKGDAAPQAVAPAASVTPPAPVAAPVAQPEPPHSHPRAKSAAQPAVEAQAPAATPAADKPAKDKPRRERKPKPQASLWKPEDFVVEPQEGKTRFHDFKLSNEVMHAIHDLGFPYCTPIQAQVLGYTLRGQDAIGRAQTGTGKTAAFLISIISQLQQTPPPKERYMGEPRALIIAPTASWWYRSPRTPLP